MSAVYARVDGCTPVHPLFLQVKGVDTLYTPYTRAAEHGVRGGHPVHPHSHSSEGVYGVSTRTPVHPRNATAWRPLGPLMTTDLG